MEVSLRSYISYKCTLINPIEDSNEPVFNIVNSCEMITEINNNYKKQNKKYLYFNKDKIHNLLYLEEENIIINDDKNTLFLNNNISELFYLDLLILDNAEQVNYTYSIDIIKVVNNFEKNSNFKLKNIIISKIVLILIFNFKGLEEYNEDKEISDELDRIENENIDNIKNNLEILKELNCNYGLNDLKDTKIDNIYLAILISLIKQNKFNDYNSIEEILNQINLDSINITKAMLEGLSEE